MNKKSNHSHEEARVWPTAQQFIQDPCAKELRQICLEICACMQALMNGSSTQDIERLYAKLIKQGITPNCQTKLDQAMYSDPLTMAEYVAGQCLTWQGDHIPSQEQIARVGASFVREHSMAGMLITQGSDLPNVMKRFIAAGMFVDDICKFLDVERDQIDSYQENYA